MVEYIDLNTHSRLVIDADPAPLDMRRDDCITGCYTPPSWWGHPTEGPLPVFEFPGNIVQADDRLWQPDSWEPERLINRWAWTFYGLALRRFGETYWYCDRNAFAHLHGGDFTREIQHSVIEAEHEAYVRYLAGEARIVGLQRKATFKRVTKRYHDKQEDLLEVWEDAASIGDVYLEPEYTPAHVAFENFELHSKERAVITAMIDEARTERTLS